jgi:hypothetical protein
MLDYRDFEDLDDASKDFAALGGLAVDDFQSPVLIQRVCMRLLTRAMALSRRPGCEARVAALEEVQSQLSSRRSSIEQTRRDWL